MGFDHLISLGISIIIGGLIGLEREKNKQKKNSLSAVGIRTDILISLFGAVSAFIGQHYNPIFFILCLGAILILTISSYVYLMIQYKRIGITTEISTILVFLYGAMCMAGYDQLAIILAIITTLVLSIRKPLHRIIHHVSSEELFDSIKFAVIAFIILPFLPNQDFDIPLFQNFFPQTEIPKEFTAIQVLNPYKIWFLVVLVSGISFMGYILVKIFGKKKGIPFAGLLGGLYSSTATSLTLAQKSKDLPKTHIPFVAGIILACAISFLRTFIEIRALNEQLFLQAIGPLGAMFIYLLMAGLYFRFTSEKEEIDSSKTLETPFKLKEAIKLGGYITGTLLLAKLLLSYSTIEWYYIVSGLMAFFAIDDPIVISASATAGKLMSYEEARNIVVMVTFLNMAQKVGLVYFFGNRKLIKYIAPVFGGLLLVTLISMLYF